MTYLLATLAEESVLRKEIWRKILSSLLAWDSNRIETWMKCWSNQFELQYRGAIWFFHDRATKYIAQLFVQDIANANLDLCLIEKICNVLERDENGIFYFDANFNWSNQKTRMSALLSTYQLQLPDDNYCTKYEQRIRDESK